MTIRVGESWTARNGHRRWISLPLHDLLIGYSVWAAVFVPFLILWWLAVAGLWLAAESALILATAVLALVALARHEARFPDVTLTRVRSGLWMVDVR